MVTGTDVRHTRRTRFAPRWRRNDADGPGGRRRAGDPGAARGQPRDAGHEVVTARAGAEAASAEPAPGACPTWSCSTGCCPAQSGLAFAQRAARMTPGPAIAHHHADRAADEERQGRGARGRGDDYVTKPFSPARTGGADQGGAAPARAAGGAGAAGGRARLRLDPATHASPSTAQRAAGPTEFRLLRFFITHPDASTPARSCSTRSGATTSSSRNAPWTCTSAACARRSSRPGTTA